MLFERGKMSAARLQETVARTRETRDSLIRLEQEILKAASQE
jgi:hypothetical protein